MSTMVGRTASMPYLIAEGGMLMDAVSDTRMAHAAASGCIVPGSAAPGEGGPGTDGAVALRVTPWKPRCDDRQYRFLRLVNGVRVMLVADDAADKGAAAVSVQIGHMSDPWTAPGLSHMLEHLLFYSSAAYPEEGGYKEFLKKHAGGCNASTAAESTTYHLFLQHGWLAQAVDRQSQFFIAPTMSAEGVDREVNAVNSENAANVNNDARRLLQVRKAAGAEGHPWRKFGTGNLSTLKTGTAADLHHAVVDHYQRFYSSQLMTVAIVGRATLDELEAMVIGRHASAPHAAYHTVPDRGLPPMDAWPHPYAGGGGRVYLLNPIKDVRLLKLVWPIPSPPSPPYDKASAAVSHCIGHEGQGSLLQWLKSAGWASALSAGASHLQAFSTFEVDIHLTADGMAQYDAVIAAVYRYVSLLVAASDADVMRIWGEKAQMASNSVRFAAKTPPLDAALAAVSAMARYPAVDCLVAGSLLPTFPDLVQVRALVAALTPANGLVFVQSQAWATEEGLTSLQRKHAASGGVSTHREPWYGFDYWVAACTPHQLAQWGAGAPPCPMTPACTDDVAAGGGGAGSTPASPRLDDAGSGRDASQVDAKAVAAAMHLPAPNPFIPSQFDLVTHAESGVDTLDRVSRWTLTVPPCEWDCEEAALLVPDPAAITITGDAPSPPVTASYPEPVPVVSSPALTVWYRGDNRFALPRAYLGMRAVVPAALALGTDLRHACLLSLFRLVLVDLLKPVTYDAAEAGLSFDVDVAGGAHCLMLMVAGYHHKLPALLETVCRSVTTTVTTGHPQFLNSFTQMHDAAVRTLRNASKAQPRTRAEAAVYRYMASHSYTEAEQLATMESITASELAAWAAAVFNAESLNPASCTVMVYGNVSQDVAVAWARDAARWLGVAVDGAATTPAIGAALAAYPFTMPVALRPGVTYVITEPHPNPSELNCAVHMSFQVGISTLRNTAMAHLLSAVLNHYAFDTLRTKEQLGYVVASGVDNHASSISLYMAVQSTNASVAHVQARMDAFLQRFVATVLEPMGEAELVERKAALWARLLEPHKTQGSEFSSLWSKVTASLLAEPEFHRINALAAAVKGVTKAQLIAFFKRVMVGDAAARMVARVYATTSTAATATPAGGVDAAATATPIPTSGGGTPVTSSLHDGGPTTVPDGVASFSGTAVDISRFDLPVWQALVEAGGVTATPAADAGAALEGLRWLPSAEAVRTSPAWRVRVDKGGVAGTPTT